MKDKRLDLQRQIDFISKSISEGTISDEDCDRFVSKLLNAFFPGISDAVLSKFTSLDIAVPEDLSTIQFSDLKDIPHIRSRSLDMIQKVITQYGVTFIETPHVISVKEKIKRTPLVNGMKEKILSARFRKPFYPSKSIERIKAKAGIKSFDELNDDDVLRRFIMQITKRELAIVSKWLDERVLLEKAGFDTEPHISEGLNNIPRRALRCILIYDLTVEDFREKTDEELLEFPGIGRSTLATIRAALKKVV